MAFDMDDQFVCEECDEEFESEAELREHYQEVHEQKKDSGLKTPRRRRAA